MKARALVTQLDQWLVMDDGKPTVGDGASSIDSKSTGQSSNGFGADVAEMKRLLRDLQAGRSA